MLLLKASLGFKCLLGARWSVFFIIIYLTGFPTPSQFHRQDKDVAAESLPVVLYAVPGRRPVVVVSHSNLPEKKKEERNEIN